MEIRVALREQYHGGLAMLRECIEKCPDDLWLQGAHPRTYCRIAWHTLYFTHNYLVQTEQDFDDSLASWPAAIRSALLTEEQKPIAVEPYELAQEATSPTRHEMLDYLHYTDGLVDATVDSLDLDRTDTGFSWYPNMTKLSHQLMNLRHLQGHVGQLSELLMARGIDISWIAKR